MSITEVIATDEFKAWYIALDDADTKSVFYSVTLLEQLGPNLDYPHSSAINNSAYALRELRVQSKGRPLRVFYAFDPKRQAVLLLGADKTGDKRFYEKLIPQAEKLLREYLAE